MQIKDLQELLNGAGAGLVVDGVAGPATRRAVESFAHAARVKLVGDRWQITDRDLQIQVAQYLLTKSGFPVQIDGKYGPETRQAIAEWRLHRKTGRRLVIDRAGTGEEKWNLDQLTWPRQTQTKMGTFYGAAGSPECTAGVVPLKVPFILAWDLSKTVTRIRCHERVAQPLRWIFDEAISHYGPDRFVELGLNIFGGCYNYRPMRGGTSLSTHAWGAAVDLDPARNQLKWNGKRAVFARAEYAPFWDLVEAAGAVSLGRHKDFDWMHFQFARL